MLLQSKVRTQEHRIEEDKKMHISKIKSLETMILELER